MADTAKTKAARSKAMKAAWARRKLRAVAGEPTPKAAAAGDGGTTCEPVAKPKVASENRTGSGQFKPGQSGNPGGRTAVPPEVREASKAMTVDALQTLKDVMMDTEQNGSARVGAANSILDRAWGKAQQNVTVDYRDEITTFLASLSDGRPEAGDGDVEGEPGPVRH